MLPVVSVRRVFYSYFAHYLAVAVQGLLGVSPLSEGSDGSARALCRAPTTLLFSRTLVQATSRNRISDRASRGE